jgi:uncharacterized protein (UPF0147 family)
LGKNTLESPTIQQAAKVAGIGEVTLWRWLQIPEFKEAYREAKKKTVSQAINRLQQLTGEAVETLRTIMNDNENPSNVRVTAAKTIIEQSIKATELEELLRRVEELEKIVTAKKGV